MFLKKDLIFVHWLFEKWSILQPKNDGRSKDLMHKSASKFMILQPKNGFSTSEILVIESYGRKPS